MRGPWWFILTVSRVAVYHSRVSFNCKYVGGGSDLPILCRFWVGISRIPRSTRRGGGGSKILPFHTTLTTNPTRVCKGEAISHPPNAGSQKAPAGERETYNNKNSTIPLRGGESRADTRACYRGDAWEGRREYHILQEPRDQEGSDRQ